MSNSLWCVSCNISLTMGNLLQIVVPLFAVTSMLSVGLSYSTRQIVSPLKHRRGVLRAIGTNFILVPLLAIGIGYVLALQRASALGLLLVGLAAGAPFLVKLTQVARGGVAFSATLLILLVLVTIVYMPVVVPLIAPEVDVNAFDISLMLSVTMFLPLAIGHLVRAIAPRVAAPLAPIMGVTSSITLLVLVVATFIQYSWQILNIGMASILGAILLTGAAFALGYFLINPSSQNRGVMGLATAQRNVAAATVVAQSFEESGVLVMVVVTSLVGLVVLFPIAWTLRKANERKMKNLQSKEPSKTIRRTA